MFWRHVLSAAIKLDRAFTHQMESKKSARALVKAAIDMVHVLGKTVVAEGVENAGQLSLLQPLGCDTMQGYHIGRPVPRAAAAKPGTGGASGQGPGDAVHESAVLSKTV